MASIIQFHKKWTEIISLWIRHINPCNHNRPMDDLQWSYIPTDLMVAISTNIIHQIARRYRDQIIQFRLSLEKTVDSWYSYRTHMRIKFRPWFFFSQPLPYNWPYNASHLLSWHLQTWNSDIQRISCSCLRDNFNHTEHTDSGYYIYIYHCVVGVLTYKLQYCNKRNIQFWKKIKKI